MSDAVVANSRSKKLPVQSIHHLLGMLPTWFLVLDFPDSKSEQPTNKESKPAANSRRVKTRYYSYEVFWAGQPESEKANTKPAGTGTEKTTSEEAKWIVRQSGR
mgnify:CR=1 FL=1